MTVKPLTDAQIDAILGIDESKEQAGGVFMCHKCHSREHTNYRMKQDRSADEGSTAYVHCKACNIHWKERV